MTDYLLRGRSLAPKRVAFRDELHSFTYAELDEMSRDAASGLVDLVGDRPFRAAIFSPNDARAFVALIAAVRAGGAWVPVNVRNPVSVSAAYLSAVGCEVLLFHSDLAAEAEALAELVPSIRVLVCIDDQPGPGQHGLSALRARGADRPMKELAPDPDRVMAVYPTGGTTGLSKAAVWTDRVWQAATTAFWTCMPARGPATHLVVAPMTHAAGGVALWMMAQGATSVMCRGSDPGEVLKAIEEHDVTHLFVPPTLLYMMLAHPRVGEFDYSSLEYLLLAAAPVAPEKVREAMSVFNSAVCQSYGQAEAPMFLTFMASRDLVEADAADRPDRYASCGRPTLNTQVEVMDESGRLLSIGARGEIVCRGDLIFAGYFADHEASDAVSAHGWHHTGDIGFKDDEGFVYISDRKKDMIITGGFNVYSAEVEQVVLGHPGVQDCAVVGLPDEKWGEAVVAFVQTKSGAHVEPAAVQERVRRALGPVHAPKRVVILAELPKSPNGKVLKRELRDRHGSSMGCEEGATQ